MSYFHPKIYFQKQGRSRSQANSGSERMAEGREAEDDNFSIELQSQSESESEGPLDLIEENTIKAPDLLGEIMREEEALDFVPKTLQTKKKKAIIKQLRNQEVKQSVATIFSSLRHHNTYSQKQLSSIDSRSQQSSIQPRPAANPQRKQVAGLLLTKQKVLAVKHYFDSNPDIAYSLANRLKSSSEQSVRTMARHFQIGMNSFRNLRRQWLKNPNMPQVLMKVQYRVRPSDHILLITHFIREIMKKEDNLSIEELKERVREMMPNDLKDKVNTYSVRNALLFKNENSLNHSIALSSKQRQKIKGLSSRTQYCRNVIALLESGRKVYFLAEERIAFGRQNIVPGQSEKEVYFRGLLGTDNLAYWDYFDTTGDFDRNKSLRFLLRHINFQDKESEKRMVMSKQLMRSHNEALMSAAEEGFVLVEFAETMREYNPITFWVRDLKARARKNGMRTRDDLKQFFHYECGCVEKWQYQGYVSEAKRAMQVKIEDDRA